MLAWTFQEWSFGIWVCLMAIGFGMIRSGTKDSTRAAGAILILSSIAGYLLISYLIESLS
jgi:cytochrome c biogenesis factor